MNEKIAGLLTKIKELAEEYAQSPRCFPLQFIVRAVEVIRCRQASNENQMFMALLCAGIPYIKLLQIYFAYVFYNLKRFKVGLCPKPRVSRQA